MDKTQRFRVFWRGAYVATYRTETAKMAIHMHARAFKCRETQWSTDPPATTEE